MTLLSKSPLYERATTLTGIVEKFCDMSWVTEPTLNETLALDQMKQEYLQNKKLIMLIQSTFGNPDGTMIRPYTKTLLVTPGNGYLSTIDAVCIQLLLHPEKMMVVPSSRDLFGKMFIDHLRDSGFQDVLEVVDPTLPHDQKRVKAYRWLPDLAVVYGSNETCRQYKEDLFNYTRAKVITYGSKTSIGYHTYPLTLKDHVDEYAEDFFSYDGTGCLNTSALYVKMDLMNKDLYHEELEMVEAFATELAKKRESFCIPNQGARTTNSLQTQLMHSGKDFKNFSGVFIREPVRSPILSGGHGTAMIVLVTGIHDITWEWEGHEEDLSSATYSNMNMLSILNPEVQELLQIGCSRMCKPGKAQHPGIHWRHDGHRIIHPDMYREARIDN